MANQARREEAQKTETETAAEEEAGKDAGQKEVILRSREKAAKRAQKGYPALLNLEPQPHWTVFLTDFVLSPADVRRVQRQLKTVQTRLLFIGVDRGLEHVMRQMRSAGVDLRRDYISLQGIVCSHENLALLEELFDRLPRRDLARVDVPVMECGFKPSFATQLLKVVMRADYVEQDRISDRFFDLLGRRNPYDVTVETRGGKLHICDNRPWFELAGRLRGGETRSLPDGEVAYSSEAVEDEVEGEFVVDGAILPIAQHPRFAEKSLRLMRLSRQVRREPFCLKIRRGQVVAVTGDGSAPEMISRLFENNKRYRRLNEIGISFNGASRRYIHSWPAASNEVRPGVHVGIGGAANPDDENSQRSPLVHIDCIAANCRVFVNGQPFLRASS